MADDRRDREERDQRGGRNERSGPRDGGGQNGPEGTEFLDLEITQVLAGEAQRLAREAAGDILRDALKARLRARLGAKLEALAHVAADALADEVETNLAIEALIRAQGERKRDVEERLRQAMEGTTERRDGATKTDARSGATRRPGKRPSR